MISALFIAIFAVLLAFLGRNEKKHSFFLLSAFVLLTTFLSLGYYWGNDVSRYEERFDYLTNHSVSLFNFSEYGLIALKEYGFVFINLLCKPLGFWGMRAVLFILENAIIYYFILRHVDKKWYWLAVFIYVFNPNLWALSSSMMRQWLAICLVILAVEFLLSNKLILFIIFVVLASTIHISALVCFIFWPLSIIQKNPNKGYVGYFLIILLIYYIVSPLFISTLSELLTEEDLYMGYTSRRGGVGITAVGRMIIYLIMLNSALNYNSKDKLLFWIVLLYGFVLPLLSFGELSSRIGYYFTVFTIVVYPSYMAHSSKGSAGKNVLIGIVCAYFMYMFFSFFTGPTYSGAYYTYRMIPFVTFN